MPRRSIRWQPAFLIALEKTGSVTVAAQVAGIDRAKSYHYKRTDEKFAALWDRALDQAADSLEDEARKRAFAGSDVLLMFSLKGIRPQKWRESRHYPARRTEQDDRSGTSAHCKAKRSGSAGASQLKAYLHCYFSVMRVFCAATNCQAPFIFTNVKVTRY
jgi:hypothetical protein